MSLNNTLGGAFCIDGKLIQGENQKAGEFGHMILVPEGKQCYCGKLGCADAYCAASALTDEKCQTLEQFMKSLENKETNMDIILGGEVGGYLTEYMIPLGEKVMEYNGFDHDVRYLKMCSYKREASAVGAAKHFLQEFIKNM